MVFRRLISRLEEIAVAKPGPRATDDITDIINENKELLLDLIREQMATGIDGFNKPITIHGNAFYHPKTIRNKSRKEGIAGITTHVTLYGRGNFYARLNLRARKRRVSVFSDVPYFEKIMQMSGENVLKLTPENLSWFRRTILIPELNVRRSHR